MLAQNLMSRLKRGEINLAKSILRWKLRKEGKDELSETELEQAATRLLAEAREIARKRGKNLYEILKEEAKRLSRS